MGKKNILLEKFGRLTVIQERGSTNRGNALWLCRCDCGNEIVAMAGSLLSGNTSSCGCAKKDHMREMGLKKFEDLSGQKFSRLTIIKRVENFTDNHSRWLCRCDCEKELEVNSNHLKSGRASSCGCKKITHGLSYTKEYKRVQRHKRREMERKLDFEWTAEMEIALCNFQPICVVCGGNKAMSTDHVKALSRDFGLKPGNAVRLCRSCNSTKWKHTLDRLKPDIREKIVIAAQQFLEYWTIRNN